ncbi:hypothetical protein BDZ89DRAFT_1057343 [Hymenopellis radicata]|nr:hypothetical protein BDZ89DRAFT_1057343 [Hymenopellis radicata]
MFCAITVGDASKEKTKLSVLAWLKTTRRYLSYRMACVYSRSKDLMNAMGGH